jgi:hypothetical protein
MPLDGWPAQAYDLQLAVAHFAHQGTNLGCADVDSENIMSSMDQYPLLGEQ